MYYVRISVEIRVHFFIFSSNVVLYIYILRVCLALDGLTSASTIIYLLFQSVPFVNLPYQLDTQNITTLA